jgi:glutamate synthase (NADPH/NADH) small chain
MSTTGTANPNSKYAWREVSPASLPKRSASERVSDFLEIYGLFTEEAARKQASRCIQCPNPTCVGGCPQCNPIPEWMRLTAEGRFLEAAALLGSATNLTEICARLCPKERMCEETCILNGVSEPVAIRDVEQFLVEYAIAHGQADSSTAPPNGLRVAVVGSGPGGLACADELAKLGYAVTVFDSSLVPGGLLVHGTPAFKLDKSVVQRRIELLRKRGVVFQLGATLGEDLTLSRLREAFDAIYLGLDSRQARPLEIPGADLKGVAQALTFLLQKNTTANIDLPPLEVAGKRVVVVGAGDVAIDCLRAALRCGAREALGVYRRHEACMPCTRHQYENAVEEGVRFLFSVLPVEVLGRPDGWVRALRLVQTEAGSPGSDGRPEVVVRPGTEFELETDWVIPALGFSPQPCSHQGDLGELAVNDWGGLVVDAHLMTNVRGVFAGGDIVRGPTPVLHTVRDARHAATRIHQFLQARRAA